MMYEFEYDLDGNGTWETVSKTKKTKEKTKTDPRAVPVKKPGAKGNNPAGAVGTRRQNKPNNNNIAGKKPAPQTDWRATAKKKADTSEMQKRVLLKNVQIGRPTKNSAQPLMKEQTTNVSSKNVGERENLSRRSRVAGKTNFNSFQEYNDSFPDLPRNESNEDVGAMDQDYTNDHPFYDLNGCDVTEDVLRLLNATFMNDPANLSMLHQPAIGELAQLCQPPQEYAVQDGLRDNIGYKADGSYADYAEELDTMNYNIFPCEVNFGAEAHNNPPVNLFNIPVDEAQPNVVEVQSTEEAHQEVKVNNLHHDINLEIQSDFQEQTMAEKTVFSERREHTPKGCVQLRAPDTGNGNATSAKIPTKKKKKVKPQNKKPDKEIMPLNIERQDIKDIQENCTKESKVSTQGATLGATSDDRGDLIVRLPIRVNKETNLTSDIETQMTEGVNDCKKNTDNDFVTLESPSIDSLASAVANLDISRSDSNTIFKSDNQNNNCQEAATDDEESCLELTGLESQCNPDFFKTMTHDVINETEPKTSNKTAARKQAEGSRMMGGHRAKVCTGAAPLLQDNTAPDKGMAIIDMTYSDGGGNVKQKTNNDAKFNKEACPGPTPLLQENTENQDIADLKEVQVEPVDLLTFSPDKGMAGIKLTDPKGGGNAQRNPTNDAECNKGKAHDDAVRMCHPCTGTSENAGLKERLGDCVENQDDAREPIVDRKMTEGEGGHIQQNQQNDAKGDNDNAQEDAVRMCQAGKGALENPDPEDKQAQNVGKQENAREAIVDRKVTYGEVIEYVLEQLKELYAGKDVNRLSPVIKIEHKPLPEELTRHVSLLRQLSYNYTPSFHPYDSETVRCESSDSDMSDSFVDTEVDRVDEEEEERAGHVAKKGEYMGRFHEKLQVFAHLNHLHQVASNPRLAAILEDGKLRGITTQLPDNDSQFFPDRFKGSTPTVESFSMNTTCGITETDSPSDITTTFENMSFLPLDNGQMREAVEHLISSHDINTSGMKETGKEMTEETPGPIETSASHSAGPTFQKEGTQCSLGKSEMRDGAEAPLQSLIASPHQASDKGLQFFQHSFLSSPDNVSDGANNPGQDSSEFVSAVKTHFEQSSNLEDIRRFLWSQLMDIRSSLDRDILGLTRATASQKEHDKRAWQGGDMTGTCRHDEEGNPTVDEITVVTANVATDLSIDDEDLLEKGWMDRTLVDNLANPKDEEPTEKRNRREYRTRKFGVLPYWWMP